MYLNKVTITGIRSLQNLTWSIESTQQQAGWHVILGNNGSGKSTFLRAIALALVGPTQALASQQDFGRWLNNGKTTGTIALNLTFNPELDQFAIPGQPLKKNVIDISIEINKDENIVKLLNPSKSNTKSNPEKNVWSGKEGWFSAAYGPFRRFTGGNKEYDKLLYSHPKLAAHLSIFGEDVALTESLSWLKELKFKQLEGDPQGALLDYIIEFINQSNFLPYETRLTNVSSKNVEFRDGNGCEIEVEELSDGYRSILSMTFELIRQLTRVYGAEKVFDKSDKTKIISPGVVLIDEIDAHLHPIWQRRIGLWFREHFPNLQFIVTTHSPLICQAAENGTVFRLPLPGSDEAGRMITGIELERLLYGNVLEAYDTEAFGLQKTRSDASQEYMQRLAELNQKELFKGLTSKERQEQQHLNTIMPIANS